MKLLKRASLLAAIAILSLPSIIAVEAAETAKAMLKDAKGENVGSVSLMQTPAGVLLQFSLKGLPPGEHAFHIHAVGKCEPPGFESAAGISIQAARTMGGCQVLDTPAICLTCTFRQVVPSISKYSTLRLRSIRINRIRSFIPAAPQSSSTLARTTTRAIRPEMLAAASCAA